MYILVQRIYRSLDHSLFHMTSDSLYKSRYHQLWLCWTDFVTIVWNSYIKCWGLFFVILDSEEVRKWSGERGKESFGQVWWLVNELWFKRYIWNMHPVSCPSTHHDVTDLIMGWLKIQKLEYLENGT